MKKGPVRWILVPRKVRCRNRTSEYLPFLWKSEDSFVLATDWECKALEHIRRALWLLCGWNCLFLYTILNEESARRVDFSTQKGPASKSDLRVPTFFPMEKCGFVCFSDRLGMQGIGTHKK